MNESFPILIDDDSLVSASLDLTNGATADLDGSTGLLRQQDKRLNTLAATTDAQAIRAWLDNCNSSGTRRVYAKEAERILLWCLNVAKKPLSSLYLPDYRDYYAFLRQPPHDWIGPRCKRTKPDWKPFAGPLSGRAAQQSMTIIKALLTYLVTTGYLIASPIAGKIKWEANDQLNRDDLSQRLNTPDPAAHVFTLPEVDAIKYATQQPEFSEDEQEIDERERKRWLITLLFSTGMRISEVANHTMGSFRLKEGTQQQELWQLWFIGKGGKKRWLPVSDRLLKALKRFRVHLGLTALPLPTETTPLIPSLRTGKSVSDRRLHQLVTHVLAQAADDIEAIAPHSAQKLRSATPHWFRHTVITEVGRYADVRLQRDFAGHADIRTTMLYNHSDEEALYHAISQSLL